MKEFKTLGHDWEGGHEDLIMRQKTALYWIIQRRKRRMGGLW